MKSQVNIKVNDLVAAIFSIFSKSRVLTWLEQFEETDGDNLHITVYVNYVDEFIHISGLPREIMRKNDPDLKKIASELSSTLATWYSIPWSEIQVDGDGYFGAIEIDSEGHVSTSKNSRMNIQWPTGFAGKVYFEISRENNG